MFFVVLSEFCRNFIFIIVDDIKNTVIGMQIINFRRY